MARITSLFVRRPAPPVDAPPPPDAGASSIREPALVPPPGAMRRERRALLHRRETGIRDLGGLLLEMVRRDRFKPDLLYERADRVIAVEQRINELDSLLVSSQAARGLRRVPRCACGAPLPPGAHFCSHCGRPARTSPPVAACEHCGQPLPADTNFCAFCGNPIGAPRYSENDIEATAVAPPPASREDGA